MQDKTLSALVRENEAVAILVEQRACQEAVVSSTAGKRLRARIFHRMVKTSSF